MIARLLLLVLLVGCCAVQPAAASHCARGDCDGNRLVTIDELVIGVRFALGAEVVEYASDEVRIFPARWKKHLLLLEKVNTAATRLLPWWSFSHIAVLRLR